MEKKVNLTKINQLEIKLGGHNGKGTCHKTGESAVATGAEGADGVCVLIMYCSGAVYLKGKRDKEFVKKMSKEISM